MVSDVINNSNGVYKGYAAQKPYSSASNTSKAPSPLSKAEKPTTAKKVTLAVTTAAALSLVGVLVLTKGKLLKTLAEKIKPKAKQGSEFPKENVFNNSGVIHDTKPNPSTASGENALSNRKPVADEKPPAAETTCVEKPKESETTNTVAKSVVEAKKIPGTNVDAIQSDEEYLEVLEKLKKGEMWRKQWKVEGVNSYEEGLIPYIGEADISDFINTFLREGKAKPSWLDFGFSDDVVKDYVRVVEYALRKTEEAQNSYKGVVYRYGWFDPAPRSFTSTASSPHGAVCHAGRTRPYAQRYNIIMTKHGAEIQKVQEKMGNKNFAEHEQEVILSPGHNFEEITTMTPELEELKQKLYGTMKSNNGYLDEKSVDLHFWREI